MNQRGHFVIDLPWWLKIILIPFAIPVVYWESHPVLVVICIALMAGFLVWIMGETLGLMWSVTVRLWRKIRKGIS